MFAEKIRKKENLSFKYLNKILKSILE